MFRLFSDRGYNEAEIKFFDAAKNGNVSTINDFFNNKIPVTKSAYFKTREEEVDRNFMAIEFALDNRHESALIAIIQNAITTRATNTTHQLIYIFMKGIKHDLDQLVSYLLVQKRVDLCWMLPISIGALSLENYSGLGPPWSFHHKSYLYKSGSDDHTYKIYRGFQTPLYLACENGSVNVVALLLSIRSPYVSVTDGKYGLYKSYSSTIDGDGTAPVTFIYNERAVEIAQKYPRIDELLSQYFTPNGVLAAIRAPQPPAVSSGCVIC